MAPTDWKKISPVRPYKRGIPTVTPRKGSLERTGQARLPASELQWCVRGIAQATTMDGAKARRPAWRHFLEQNAMME